MRMFRALAFAIFAFSFIAPASASQYLAGDLLPLTGAGGKIHAAAAGGSFTGPGDIKPTSAFMWGSCARVFKASLASTSTNLCDLADSTNGAVTICTLRATSTGFVDLTTCAGGGNPITVCAAATGGHCFVTKIYDQTGNSRHLTQSTATNAPRLDFNVSNGLPGANCIGSGIRTLMGGPAITLPQPYSASVVYIRINTSGPQLAIGVSLGGTRFIDFGSARATANTAVIDAGTPVTFTATSDSTMHAMNGVFNDPGNSAVMLDSADNTGLTVGTAAAASQTFEICEDSLASTKPNGPIMEVGMWSSAMTPTERTNIDANQRSLANGYNF